MIFSNRPFKALFMFVVLFFSAILVFTPVIPNYAGAVDEEPLEQSPIGIIYKTGTWVVNTTESYNDAEIVITGNLIIQSGGVLTLRNTTLIMNCSLFANPLWIRVKSGGELRIWDSDDDPTTKEDRSLINDSINDVDDGGILDYRYYFRVEENGVLNINNSIIRECGKYDYSEPVKTWGLYLENENTVIRNTSFDNCDRAVVLRHADNTTLEYVNMTNVDLGVDGEYANGTTIKYCWLNSSTLNQAILIKNSNNLEISNNNFTTYYAPVDLEYVERSLLNNNHYSLTSTSSGYSGLSLYYCENITITNSTGYSYRKVLQFDYCANITIYNFTVRSQGTNLVYDQASYASHCKFITFGNCQFYYLNGYALKFSYTDDIIIKNCTFNNTARDGVNINRATRFLIHNCTFDNSSGSSSFQAIYLTFAYDGMISNCNITYSNYRDISISWAANLKIVNNTIGTNRNTQYGIYCSRLENSYIINNNLYYQYYGIYLSVSGNNLIYNNYIIGDNEQGYAIRTSSELNPSIISNCTIFDFSWGIDGSQIRMSNTNISKIKNYGLYGSGIRLVNVTFYDCNRAIYVSGSNPIIALNCSIIASRFTDIYIFSPGNITLINCSFNEAKITQFSGGSRVYIGHWVDVFVEDIKGFVPGALVTVYNKTGFKEVEGLTGDDGHVLLPVIEKFRYDDLVLEIFDWNPHNITAYLYPDIANVTPKPTVTSNDFYTITFTGNTYPAPPQNLLAESLSDDVLLTWDYPNLIDLDHFEIFRSLDPVNFIFTVPIGIASNVTRMWIDIDGASDWMSYYYCIRAKDTINQLGNASNVDGCGDWVVAFNVHQDFSGLNLQMNGSIIVESGGSLNLSDVKIIINATKEDRFGILVRSGGVLRISDVDNDSETTSDASNITSLNTSIPIFMKIEPFGKIFMNNSIGYNIGFFSKEQDNIVGYSGIYIAGSGSVIRGNLIFGTSGSYNGIEIIGTTNVLILDNIFSQIPRNPIYLINSFNCVIDNNTIIDIPDEAIYSLNSMNITISNNTISYCPYALYITDSPGFRIVDNVFYNNTIGIYVRYAGNYLIHNNTMFNITGSYGMYIYYSDYSIYSENFIYNCQQGIRTYRSYYQTFISNRLDEITETGLYIYDCTNSKLINNTISNCGNQGIMVYDRAYNYEQNTIITGGNITGCLYGIQLSVCYFIDLEHVDIWDNLYGLYVQEGGTIRVNECNIQNNMGLGIFAEYLAYEQPYSLLVENTTLNNPFGKELGVDEGAVIIVINVSIPFNRIQFNDGESKIAFMWYVDFYVSDMFDQPAMGAEVKLQQISGEYRTGYTNSKGYLKWQLVHERTSFSGGNISFNPYTITATLGNHSGENETIISGPVLVKVKLTNQPPNVIDIGISPLFATTLNNLELSFGYSDPEGDPKFPHMIKWYVNGVENKTCANATTINNSITSKGEVWFARVWVFDGVEYSEPLDSNWVAIQNTPPVCSNVILSPSTPSSTTDVSVSYLFDDVDDDTQGESIVEWWVDRGDGFSKEPISGATLPYSYTKKSEHWKARVRPNDGEDYGDWVESAPISIGNTPPSVTDVKILSLQDDDELSSNDTLKVVYDFNDIDVDLESGSIIKWFKNGFEQYNLNGSLTIDPSHTKKGDNWQCEVTPSDGEHFGEPLRSDSVSIGNTPPIILNIAILPENPTTADDLTVTYEFSDSDNDGEDVNTTIEWLRKRPGDIEFSHTGLKVRQLSSVYTTKGEVWTCTITPHDGLEFGLTVRCEMEIEIINQKPTVSNVQITPNNPTTTTVIKAEYDYSDLDDDSESGSEITWYQDYIAIPELNNKMTVPNSYTKKGQVWYYTIRPNDGFDFGSLITSSNITIQNNPPTAKDLFINPSEPSGDDALTAVYNFVDEDGDSESSSEIRWYKNGLLQSLYNDKLTIDSNATEKGEIWYFILRVNDGETFGDAISSSYAVIENTKPIIISLSPTPGKITMNETESLEFYVRAEDPDGDLILFKWKRDKTTVSDEDYFLYLTDYTSAGIYKLNLTIQDVGKNSFTLYYIWDITVNNVNRAPTLEVKEPISKNRKINTDESLKFLIEESDLDFDDTPRITWYLDGSVAQDGGSSFTLDGRETEPGKHVVSVTVTDEIDTADFKWNVTVVDVQEGYAGLSWDEWGILIESLVVVFTAIFAVIGIVKVRKKMNKLKDYMKQIEDINESDKRSRDKEKELLELKKKIKNEFSTGLISENHYIILERMVDDALGGTRKTIVEKKVSMPDELKEDVGSVLEDGIVTEEEYYSVVEKITKSDELTEDEKQRLQRMMRHWMRESKDEDPSMEKRLDNTLDNDLDPSFDEDSDEDLPETGEPGHDEKIQPKSKSKIH